jgi:hypothetical protein
MADLDRMQGSPTVVLQEAAAVLRLNLKDAIQRSSTEALYRSSPRPQDFKEQWMLRWLLKRLGVADSKTKNVKEALQRR